MIANHELWSPRTIKFQPQWVRNGEIEGRTRYGFYQRTHGTSKHLVADNEEKVFRSPFLTALRITLRLWLPFIMPLKESSHSRSFRDWPTAAAWTGFFFLGTLGSLPFPWAPEIFSSQPGNSKTANYLAPVHPRHFCQTISTSTRKGILTGR